MGVGVGSGRIGKVRSKSLFRTIPPGPVSVRLGSPRRAPSRRPPFCPMYLGGRPHRQRVASILDERLPRAVVVDYLPRSRSRPGPPPRPRWPCRCRSTATTGPVRQPIPQPPTAIAARLVHPRGSSRYSPLSKKGPYTHYTAGSKNGNPVMGVLTVLIQHASSILNARSTTRRANSPAAPITAEQRPWIPHFAALRSE